MGSERGGGGKCFQGAGDGDNGLWGVGKANMATRDPGSPYHIFGW